MGMDYEPDFDNATLDAMVDDILEQLLAMDNLTEDIPYHDSLHGDGGPIQMHQIHAGDQNYHPLYVYASPYLNFTPLQAGLPEERIPSIHFYSICAIACSILMVLFYIFMAFIKGKRNKRDRKRDG